MTILQHQDGKSFVIFDYETGECTITKTKAKATRFPTEAAAIVALEDAPEDISENFYPYN